MKTTPRAHLLLLELVLNLLLFTLCAAVCVGLLVKAKQMSDESTRLTTAVYLAQTAAETWTPDLEQDGYRVNFTCVEGNVYDISVLYDGESVYTLKGVAAP